MKIKTFIFLILLCVFFGGIFTLSCYIDQHYSRDAIVTQVRYDIVTVEDNSGNIFEFVGDGKFKEGQKVILKMNTEGTDFIEDDTIQKVVVK